MHDVPERDGAADADVQIGLEHGTRGWQRVVVGVMAVLSVPVSIVTVISVEGWWSRLMWCGVLALGCWVLWSAAFRLTIPMRWHRALEAGAGASSEGLTNVEATEDDVAADVP